MTRLLSRADFAANALVSTTAATVTTVDLDARDAICRLFNKQARMIVSVLTGPDDITLFQDMYVIQAVQGFLKHPGTKMEIAVQGDAYSHPLVRLVTDEIYWQGYGDKIALFQATDNIIKPSFLFADWGEQGVKFEPPVNGQRVHQTYFDRSSNEDGPNARCRDRFAEITRSLPLLPRRPAEGQNLVFVVPVAAIGSGSSV